MKFASFKVRRGEETNTSIIKMKTNMYCDACEAYCENLKSDLSGGKKSRERFSIHSIPFFFFSKWPPLNYIICCK